MKINSISNNQNNSQSFGALIASKRTLKTLGTSKTKLLENPSIKEAAEKFDVYIKSKKHELNPNNSFTDLFIYVNYVLSAFVATVGISTWNINMIAGASIVTLINTLSKRLIPAKECEIFVKEKNNGNVVSDSELISKETDFNSYIVDFNPKVAKYLETPENIINLISKSSDSWRAEGDDAGNTIWHKVANFDKKNTLKAIEKLDCLNRIDSYREILESALKTKNNVGETAPELALEKGNIEFLKFFVEKGKNLKSCIEKVKNGNYSQEIQDLFKGAKYPDKKVFELEEIADSEELFDMFIEANKDLDLNTMNEYGETLLLKAAGLGNYNLFKNLIKQDGVDFYAKQGNRLLHTPGDNFFFTLLANYKLKKDEKKETDGYKKILDLALNLPKEKFDINTNISSMTPFEYAYYSQIGVDEFLNSPNIDLSRSVNSYLIRKIVKHKDVDTFMKIYTHPTFDKNKSYDDFNTTWKDLASHEFGFLNLLEPKLAELSLKKMQEIYEKEGVFSLDQIDSYLQSPRIKEFINKPINEIGDTIAQLLVDIYIDSNSYEQKKMLNSIVKRLKENQYDFEFKDLLGRTVYEKAVEAQNTELIKALENHGINK